MEYEIITLGETKLAGIMISADLSSMDDVNFKKIWDMIYNEYCIKPLEETDFCVGLEEYKQGTSEFSYYALCPLQYIKDGPFHIKTLQKGKYIRFKSEFNTHGPAFFKKVYKFIKDNNISVDYNFDFEMLPSDFRRDDEDAFLYVALKLIEVNNEDVVAGTSILYNYDKTNLE